MEDMEEGRERGNSNRIGDELKNEKIIVLDDSSSDSRSDNNSTKDNYDVKADSTKVATGTQLETQRELHTGIDFDHRKVEPLKINLSKDALKTKFKLPTEAESHSPKIIIKPLKPPPEELDVSSNSTYIPKLHIKNLNDGCPSVEIMHKREDNYAIPKLVIKTIDHKTSIEKEYMDSESSMSVPKLKITMDSQHIVTCSSEKKESLSPKVAKSPIDHGSVTAIEGTSNKNTVDPPLPKLIIKTNPDNKEVTLTPLHHVEGSTETEHNDYQTKARRDLSSPKADSSKQVCHIKSTDSEDYVPKLTIKTNKLDETLYATNETVGNSSQTEVVPKFILKIGDKCKIKDGKSAQDKITKLKDSEKSDTMSSVDYHVNHIIDLDHSSSPKLILKMSKPSTQPVSSSSSKDQDAFNTESLPCEDTKFSNNGDSFSSSESNSTNMNDQPASNEISPGTKTIRLPSDDEKKGQEYTLADENSDEIVTDEIKATPFEENKFQFEKTKASPICITIDDDTVSSNDFPACKTPTNVSDNAATESSKGFPPENVPIVDIQPILAVKRPRGRPKKIKEAPAVSNVGKADEALSTNQLTESQGVAPKKKRGRKRKVDLAALEISEGNAENNPTLKSDHVEKKIRVVKRRGKQKKKLGAINAKKQIVRRTDKIQLFTEDAVMSEDLFQSPMRKLADVNDDSQYSQSSNLSNTESKERKRGKMEVCEPEGLKEFTVDMLIEYEWPPSQAPIRKTNSEIYMIQEQVSQFLNVKSFKRKYPDLMRRTVEMEERNYIFEKGLVSEKMCDMGLTAVYAPEILDIMYTDYPEKYEEYRRYQREKQFLELTSRQNLIKSDLETKGQAVKERAIESALKWNLNFNKERSQRKMCMDLQTYVIHYPRPYEREKTKENFELGSTIYPVNLLPGQFSTHFRKYSHLELANFPLNTILTTPILSRVYSKYETDSDSQSSESSSSSCNSSESCSSDEESQLPGDEKCQVCLETQFKNTYGFPEIFIKCTRCLRTAHPSCISMTTPMSKRALEYDWKCAECKYCEKCQRSQDDQKMLFCEQCDRAYHIYCVGLRNIPEGRWHCEICAICTRCGSKKPEGHPNPAMSIEERETLSMIAKFHHSYRVNHVTKLKEHYLTLCQGCHQN